MDGEILSNNAGITLIGRWVLPTAGTTGTIGNKASGANKGYLDTYGNTAAGSAVFEEALHVMFDGSTDDGQLWERSDEDSSGYFTLMNPKSGKLLTGDNTTIVLRIEGNAIIMTHLLCISLFTMFFTHRTIRKLHKCNS